MGLNINFKSIVSMPFRYDIKTLLNNDDLVILKYNDKKLKFYLVPGHKKDDVSVLNDIFIEEAYKELDVKDKIVVDLGSYIGDSAIYFAINGAKKVYTYEASDQRYAISKQNIDINNFNNKIEIFYCAIGGSAQLVDKTQLIPLHKKFGEGSKLTKSRLMLAQDFSTDNALQMYSLNDLVKKLNLKDAILKVDIEFSEYPVILNASKETLRKFSEIEIEFGFYPPLHDYEKEYIKMKGHLKDCGFGIKVMYLHTTRDGIGTFGHIYAKRE